jgi:hypothetical protein
MESLFTRQALGTAGYSSLRSSMQRGKLDKHGTRCVPRLDSQHCFVSFIEEFWNIRGPKTHSVGRVEVFVKDDMFDVEELRWYFESTPGMDAAFGLLRNHYDFVNLTWNEYQRLKKQLKFFYQE